VEGISDKKGLIAVIWGWATVKVYICYADNNNENP